MIERFADDENGRLLRDLVGPRAARRAPQGPRGPPDPLRQLERRLRPAAPGRAHRRDALREPAESVLRLLHELAPQAPAGVRPPAPGARLPARAREGGGAGRATTSAARARRARRFRPHLVLAGGAPDGVPLLEDREPVDGRAAAYVCEQLRLQGAGDRAGRARGLLELDRHRARLAARPRRCAGRPPSVRRRGEERIPGARGRPASAREGRAQRLIGASFRRAGSACRVQEFRVPGTGRSRNVIGVLRHAARLPADRDGPRRHRAAGARRRRQRLRASAWSPRSRRGCDAAARRATSGSWPPAPRSASTRARPTTSARWRSRAGARAAAPRLRWALSLDEVGRGTRFLAALAAAAAPRRRGRAAGAAARGARASRWVRDDGTGNSDHREFAAARHAGRRSSAWAPRRAVPPQAPATPPGACSAAAFGRARGSSPRRCAPAKKRQPSIAASRLLDGLLGRAGRGHGHPEPALAVHLGRAEVEAALIQQPLTQPHLLVAWSRP